jgi:hypothetical protein
VVSQILAENALMLDFIRQLAFTFRRSADDSEIMEARLQLTMASPQIDG